MLMPTSTTYVANLAPTHMRGRYMSVYGLTWNIAQGIGPLAGGMLSDNLGPQAPWLGGGVVGLCSVLSFIMLGRRRQVHKPEFSDQVNVGLSPILLSLDVLIEQALHQIPHPIVFNIYKFYNISPL